MASSPPRILALAAILAALPPLYRCGVPDMAAGVVGVRKLATAHDCNGAVAFSGLGSLPHNGSKLAFRNALTDKGIGWSKESGDFTCFCPGLYQLAFAGSGNAKARLSLKKKLSNSDEWTTIVSTGPGGGANIALVEMDASDQAAIWLDEGELHPETDEQPTSTFTGFRIAKKIT